MVHNNQNSQTYSNLKDVRNVIQTYAYLVGAVRFRCDLYNIDNGYYLARFGVCSSQTVVVSHNLDDLAPRIQKYIDEDLKHYNNEPEGRKYVQILRKPVNYTKLVSMNDIPIKKGVLDFDSKTNRIVWKYQISSERVTIDCPADLLLQTYIFKTCISTASFDNS